MSSRQMRWVNFLADFNFDIKYVCGEDNSVADALSRMPDDTPTAGLAACTLAYTRSPPATSPPANLVATAMLSISADKEFINRIKAGYLDDDFCKKL